MDEELTSFLEAVARNDGYEVESVLKESAYERTELVVLVARNGFRFGPLIRKSIDASSGLGSAYKLLCDAQNAGRRFRFLPRVLSCERLGDELVVIMEKAPGVPLDKAVAEERSRDGFGKSGYAAWASDVFLQLCDAVDELHTSFSPPLIHRDLKPGNILLSSDGLTIVDFGIARTYRAEAESDTVRFGTCAYAPPEQFGYGQTDIRSDVYALGMVLLFMLTGRTPSAADAGNAALRLDVDSHFARIVQRATAFDPDARFGSVAELREAFEKARDCALTASGNSLFASAPLPAFPPSPNPGSRVSSLPVSRRGLRSSPGASGAGSAKWSFGEKLGLAWDVLVLGFVLMVFCASAVAVFNPTDYDLQFPLWFRLLEYVGFFSLGIAGVSFILMDKRPLGRFSPRFEGRAWRSYLPLGFGLMASSALCFVVVVVVAAVFFSEVAPLGSF